MLEVAPSIELEPAEAPAEPTPEPEAGAAPPEPDAEPGPESVAPEPGAEPTPETADAAALEPEPEAAVIAGIAAVAVPAVAPVPEAPPAEPQTVARYIAQALRSVGVRMAFGVPGESFLSLLEALPDEGIRVVTTRHEGGASFMGAAYGQLTGRAALVLGSRAVGAANLAIGVHAARQDSTSMVVIVGQVSRRFRGREAFQEADIAGSIGRLAKWATEVTDPSAIPHAMDAALRELRSGRPGPILLSLPEDLLDQHVPLGSAPAPRPRTNEIDSLAVREILHLLAGAERPVILAGGGVLRARATGDLVELAEMLEVPVIASWRRPDVFPNDHRLYLGMTGYGAPATVRERLRSADALVVVGARLNEIASFGYTVPARGQRWAHVDLEPRTSTPGLSAPRPGVSADARTFLRSAVQRLRFGVLEASRFDARREANERDRAAFVAATDVEPEPWDGPGVHPGRVVATLRRVVSPDSVLTTDAGNFASWAARGYRWQRPATFLGPTSGAMGYALPAAIAAALARPNRPVIALAGDGGFAMTMSELETAVREHARVVAIVFDNERYGTIRAHQETRGRGVAGTDLGPIDFAGLATAMGAFGVRVETDSDFEPALVDALGRAGPTVIHLVLDRRWLAIDRVLD